MKKGFANFLFNRGQGSHRGGSPRASAAASDSLLALEKFMEHFGGPQQGAWLHHQQQQGVRTMHSVSDPPVAVMHEGWAAVQEGNKGASTRHDMAVREEAAPTTQENPPASAGGEPRPPPDGEGEATSQADGAKEEAEEEISVDVREGLIPTFHQVSWPVVLRMAEASLESLERLVAYVEERWKLEQKYARERARLRLDFRQSVRMPDDSLDRCLQALALYQDVESTQSCAVVEEMEQVVRAPLLKLREDLTRVVQDCAGEWRACEKEVEALERRVAKAKVVLKGKRDRRVEIREKLEYYKRLAEDMRATGGSTTSTTSSMAGGTQQGGLRDPWDLDRFLPPSGGGGGGSTSSTSSGFSLFDERPDRESLETSVLPRLQRQLVEMEGEIRAAAGAVELAVHQLLEGLARLDHGHQRWTEAIQLVEEERRKLLHRVSSDYLLLSTRTSQLSFSQLDRLTRLMDTTNTTADMQRFVELHSSAGGGPGGTPMRSTALRLMPIGIDDLLPPKLHPYIPPTSPVRRNSSAQSSASSASTTSSPPLSPERLHQHDAAEKEPAFDEKEDTEVISMLVKQMVLPPPPPTKPAKGDDSTPGSPPPPPSDNKPRGDEGFNWDGLAAAVGEKAGGVGLLYSTPGERRRFFARIFSGPSPMGRSAFLHELNQYRARRTDVGQGFAELAGVMWSLLSECQRNSDVHNAKMAMMLSQTFWHLGGSPTTATSSSSSSTTTAGGGGESSAASAAPPLPPPTAAATSAEDGGQRSGDERSRREFLSSALMGHPLWADAAFWDQALWQCVLEQIPTIELSHGGPWHDLTGEARDDVVRRVQNIIFSQAGTLGYSMLEFGVGIPEAADFVCRVAERHQLSEEMRFTLLRHLFLHAQRTRPRSSSSA